MINDKKYFEGINYYLIWKRRLEYMFKEKIE